MPHAGMLDESSMEPEGAELMRMKLHYRSGKRRLSDGLVHEGMSTLFDAMLSGLRWYVSSPVRLAGLELRPGDDLNDERAVFDVLQRSDVLGPGLSFDRVSDTVEGLLEGGVAAGHAKEAEDIIDQVLDAIGVIPFDLSELPPEPPGLL